MIDPKRISTAGRIILGKEGHDSLKGPKPQAISDCGDGLLCDTLRMKSQPHWR
jgi:hypothetical protein